MRDLAMRFKGILRSRNSEALDEWTDDAIDTELTAIMRFASVLRRDIDAVKNAIELPWSNGQAAISTLSSGDMVLTSAASQAPVPELGKTITFSRVPKTGFRSCRSRFANSENATPRWSAVGCAIALRTAAGMLLGPGICSNCHPGK